MYTKSRILDVGVQLMMAGRVCTLLVLFPSSQRSLLSSYLRKIAVLVRLGLRGNIIVSYDGLLTFYILSDVIIAYLWSFWLPVTAGRSDNLRLQSNWPPSQTFIIWGSFWAEGILNALKKLFKFWMLFLELNHLRCNCLLINVKLCLLLNCWNHFIWHQINTSKHHLADILRWEGLFSIHH